MGEVTLGDRQIDTDPRRWDADLRRDASLLFGGIAAFFALAGLIWFVLAPGSAGAFLWVAIVLLVLLLIAEAIVLATGIAKEENVGPHWLTEPEAHAGTARAAEAEAGTAQATPPPETTTEGGVEPVAGPEIDLECPQCAEMFTVEDTGERPLAAQCPHCGAEGEVNLPEPQPDHEHDHDHEHGREHGHEAGAAVAGSGLAEEEEDLPTIDIQCPACETQFEVEDTGERPLEATCPGCGRSGKLS